MNSPRLVMGVLVAALLSLAAADARAAAQAQEQELSVGWAVADITPPQPINLIGQMNKRISKSVNDPLTATVLALETAGPNGAKEQAVMVSCDLCMTKKVAQDRLKELVKAKLSDFDADKLFLNSTHTHTGPGLDEAFGARYDVSKDPGVMTPAQYLEFFLGRVTEAVVRAWQGRKPGGMSWALGHAVVGHNRRATYFNGTSRMYGRTSREDFDAFEGYEDHSLELLFFWTRDKALTGLVINIACPSQETEGEYYISADFWHEIREEIRKRYGKETFVFAQCGAGGDQSPHLQIRQRAEKTMMDRKGIKRRQEIALRVADGIDRVFGGAKEQIATKLVFRHAVVRIELPTKDPPAQPFYETDSVTPMEMHVLRLGEVALATNPFEMYLDYGIRMKARSKAALTFVVNLACQHSGYLPTAKAVKGGGYSADKYIVGPEGGQVLVNETVKRINEFWP